MSSPQPPPDPDAAGPATTGAPDRAPVPGAPVPATAPAATPPPPTVPTPVTNLAEDDTAQGPEGLVPAGSLRLSFSAVSDVGRVRKDNQDSGYAGAWLLAVCDGVGGGARGDVASSTAVAQLRKLDEQPGPDLLGLVAGGLHRSHDRIAELVDDDPALSGTSTTATVVLFDGSRVGVAHVGDSRAYLMRSGTLTQLTRDHTFVQSLIDEGRITEAEARTHPHRNLILKALDGQRDPEPDLFVVDLAVGDRLLLCSDGACGSLTDEQMLAVLADGSPDSAALGLVQDALDAGSTDNVTCVVADVVPADQPPDPDSAAVDDAGVLAPLLVGAAAELPRRGGRGSVTGLFRSSRHDHGDTRGAADVPAEVPHAIPSDPIDPERARYAPRPPRRFLWLRRVLVLAVVVGLVWVAGAAAWSWTQQQYYVAESGGAVTIFRGVNAEVPGLSLSSPLFESDVSVDALPTTDADAVRSGIDADDLDDARATVAELASRQADEPSQPLQDDPAPSESPSPSPSDGTGGGTDSGTDPAQPGDGASSGTGSTGGEARR